MSTDVATATSVQYVVEVDDWSKSNCFRLPCTYVMNPETYEVELVLVVDHDGFTSVTGLYDVRSVDDGGAAMDWTANDDWVDWEGEWRRLPYEDWRH